MKKKILGLTEWETRVAELYSLVVHSKLPHSQMCERKTKWVWEELNRTHADGKRPVYTSYVKGYVSGLCRAHERHIETLVEFGYLENGVFFSTHRDTTHRSTEEFYAAGRGNELGHLPTLAVWKGTMQPWYPDEARVL